VSAELKDTRVAHLKFDLRWTVGVDGRPSDVAVLPNRWHRSLDGCVAQTVQGWRFPRSAMPAEPFVFPVNL
jgi:hypothetical protein